MKINKQTNKYISSNSSISGQDHSVKDSELKTNTNIFRQRISIFGHWSFVIKRTSKLSALVLSY